MVRPPSQATLINRFSHEHLPLLLYVPAGFLGHLGLQYFLSYFISPIDRKPLEKYHYHAQMIFSTAQMLALQAFRIRSAYIFAAITAIMLSGVAVRGAIGKGVWKFVLPFTLLVGASVEAVTSVCHPSSLMVWLTSRPSTSSLPSLVEWARTPHPNSSLQLYQ